MIMASHSGRPIVSVNVRCLDNLIEYGLRPIKLIRTRVKNSDDSVVLNPFNIFVWVRISCWIMFSMIVMFIRLARFVIHIDAWNINTKIRAVDIVIFVGIDELNDDGSNDEKMSGIIKIWIFPFRTLKVLSLV